MDTTEYDPMRPRAITDMISATTWTRLDELTRRPDPPHIIVAGGPGVGKSCALRFILSKRSAMWMRCNQDPTLRDNRERIKATARHRTEGVTWIILEHADLLHADAQAFLRRIIETSVGSTRFILEVRDLAAIAEPLLSRTVLFNIPVAMQYEIRAEMQRRSPACSLDIAELLAEQSAGNIRWAVLQGLGGSVGMIAPTVNARSREPTTWVDLLAAMEDMQRTGTSSAAWLGPSAWERPGGACPWALSAHILAKTIV
jgi:hypothetical protein